MQEHLLRTLIAKSFFMVSSEVDATVIGSSLDGQPVHTFNDTFTVTALLESRKTGRLVLEISSLRDGRRNRIDASAITGIDGMTPERFAENYMIAPDGSDIKVVGKRRGRRPKNWTPDMENNG